MRPYIHLPVLTSISLSLSPHVKSLFLALLNLLFSFLRTFLCLLFLPLHVLSFPPPANSTQLNFIQFHKLFNFHFICIFIHISILHLFFLYLPSMAWHSRNPTETKTPQANSSSHQPQGKPRLLHTTHVLSIFIFSDHLEHIILPSSIYSKLTSGCQYQGY